MEIELGKDLESHVKDEHENNRVDCGEMSREFGTSDFEIWRGFFGGGTESVDYFMMTVWYPMNLEGFLVEHLKKVLMRVFLNQEQKD